MGLLDGVVNDVGGLLGGTNNDDTTTTATTPTTDDHSHDDHHPVGTTQATILNTPIPPKMPVNAVLNGTDTAKATPPTAQGAGTTPTRPTGTGSATTTTGIKAGTTGSGTTGSVKAQPTGSAKPSGKAEQSDSDSDSESDSSSESGDDSDDEDEDEEEKEKEKEKESKSTSMTSTSISGSSSATLSVPSGGSGGTITGSQTRTKEWIMTTSGTASYSTLVVAPTNDSTSADQANKGSSIFTPSNKLFPLAVIAVIVAAIFFLIVTIFLFLRIFGWTRKRRDRKYVPSFYPVQDRNTMFEKLDDAETNVASTRPFNPVASTVNLNRSASDGSQYSSYQSSTVGPYRGAAGGGGQDPPPMVPRVMLNGGVGLEDRGVAGVGTSNWVRGQQDRAQAQAYDGAFFPGQYQPSDPFTKPGEYIPASDPSYNADSTWTSFGTTGAARVGTNGTMQDSDPGSPVPSFNTSRVLAQGQANGQPVPQSLTILPPTSAIPPPYMTPVPNPFGNRGSSRNVSGRSGPDLLDEYKFQMFPSEPSPTRSNASALMESMMSRSEISFSGAKREVRPRAPLELVGGPEQGSRLRNEVLSRDEGRGGLPYRPRRDSGSEGSAVGSDVSGKSKKLGKPATWGSDRV